MTIFSVYPIENYNRGMGGNSNFARPMLPTYRGCTVFDAVVRGSHHLHPISPGFY